MFGFGTGHVRNVLHGMSRCSSSSRHHQLLGTLVCGGYGVGNVMKVDRSFSVIRTAYYKLLGRPRNYPERLLSPRVNTRLQQQQGLFEFRQTQIQPLPTSVIRRSDRNVSTDDSKTKALMVISDLKELKSAPLPALALGFSGLIPLVSAPAYMIMSNLYVHDIAFAQMAYGAVILSFLGGVRWGYVVADQKVSPDWNNLGQSVIPSLVAWPSLLLPSPWSTLVVAGGLAGLAYFDVTFPGYLPWFKALRFVLSFVAVIALWSTVMCHLMLKTDEKAKM